MKAQQWCDGSNDDYENLRMTDEWGWKVCSLNESWSDYPHITREQKPAVWLAVNIALAFIYALLLAAGIDQFLAWRKRRRGLVRS